MKTESMQINVEYYFILSQYYKLFKICRGNWVLTVNKYSFSSMPFLLLCSVMLDWHSTTLVSGNIVVNPSPAVEYLENGRNNLLYLTL